MYIIWQNDTTKIIFELGILKYDIDQSYKFTIHKMHFTVQKNILHFICMGEVKFIHNCM